MRQPAGTGRVEPFEHSHSPFRLVNEPLADIAFWGHKDTEKRRKHKTLYFCVSVPYIIIAILNVSDAIWLPLFFNDHSVFSYVRILRLWPKIGYLLSPFTLSVTASITRMRLLFNGIDAR